MILSDGIPHHSRDSLERRAEEALRHYLPATLTTACRTDLLGFTRLAQKEVGFQFSYRDDLGTNARGHPILGACFFKPNLAILVSASLPSETSRFRFVLAHEIGHLTLHRNLNIDFESLDATRERILVGV